ncbi:type IV pilin-like G/H family protein [Phormidesmis priestleyi]|uniref:type IV pilin-like G/H family protein n=1 Tax=Phormidesmis priestleyi TaxID=268141 RepID=UPI00083A4AFB|nr:type IV pilin-like G/H family protein [Phormidesmis priestleyi]
MKSELKAKFLQHLVGKKKDQGFTLIELLVVIIIIGILSAIALPSFLNQANKAKQSEAKQYVGTLNRTQQARYLEKSNFSSDFNGLANPVPATTSNYDYTLQAVATDATSVINYGTSKAKALKSYNGMVAISVVKEASDATTTAVLCEAITPDAKILADPKPPAAGTSAQPTCDATARDMSKG